MNTTRLTGQSHKVRPTVRLFDCCWTVELLNTVEPNNKLTKPEQTKSHFAWRSQVKAHAPERQSKVHLLTGGANRPNLLRAQIGFESLLNWSRRLAELCKGRRTRSQLVAQLAKAARKSPSQPNARREEQNLPGKRGKKTQMAEQRTRPFANPLNPSSELRHFAQKCQI